MCIYAVPAEGIGSSGTEVTDGSYSRWMLGTDPRASARAASARNSLAIFPAYE